MIDITEDARLKLFDDPKFDFPICTADKARKACKHLKTGGLKYCEMAASIRCSKGYFSHWLNDYWPLVSFQNTVIEWLNEPYQNNMRKHQDDESESEIDNESEIDDDVKKLCDSFTESFESNDNQFDSDELGDFYSAVQEFKRNHIQGPGYIYIMSDHQWSSDTGRFPVEECARFKVGSSYNCKQRLKQFRTANIDIFLIESFKVTTNRRSSESLIHQKLKSCDSVEHLEGEWFKGRLKDIKAIIEQVVSMK